MDIVTDAHNRARIERIVQNLLVILIEFLVPTVAVAVAVAVAVDWV